MRRKDFLSRLIELSEQTDDYFQLREASIAQCKQQNFISRLKCVNAGQCLGSIPAPELPNERFNRRVLVIAKPKQSLQLNRPKSGNHAKSSSNTEVLLQEEYQHLVENSERDIINNPSFKCISPNNSPKESLDSPVHENSHGYKKIMRSQDYRGHSNSIVSASEQRTQRIGSYMLKDQHFPITPEPQKYYRASSNHVSFLSRQKKIEEERLAKINIRKQINKNYAKPFTPPPRISAKAYIIYEMGSVTGKSKMLVSYNSKNSQEVASLTKIMTCILAVEISEKSNLRLSEQVAKIGKYESSIGGTSASIKSGEIYSIEQLLYGLMLPSGNDASLALAVWGGRILLTQEQQFPIATTIRDNEEVLLKMVHQDSLSTNVSLNDKLTKSECCSRFVAEMNKKAKQLQMTKTHYSNPHGLANINNKSTAYDIALLSQYAMNNQTFKSIVSCRSYATTIKYIQLVLEQIQEDPERDNASPRSVVSVLKEREVRWENTHKLLQSHPNQYIGVKTGMTNSAGPCLCSCVSVGGRRFLIVVLNCGKVSYRFKETEVLKKWLYKTEGLVSIYKKKRGSTEATVEQEDEESAEEGD